MSRLKHDSWLVSAGRPEEPGAPLNTPLSPASNFILGGDRVYTRDTGSPAWEALEEIIGGLEGGRAVAFSSGMAAVAAVFDQLPAGARVAMPDDCYHGVSELARRGQEQGRWSIERIGVTDTAGWISAVRETDLAWLESPSNPLLMVADLEAICLAPRKPGSMLVVDNTFATPINQRPLALGADISMHSATKFIGGHSDLLGGILVAARDETHAEIRKSRTVSGATPGALEAFLAVRGARTLAVRLERAQHNAGRLARWLQEHPGVSRVRYPGLPGDPSHELATAQLDGYGAMISFELHSSAEQADEVCQQVQLISHATSLGSVESTMERRAAVPGQQHLPPTLLRLSVGIENFEDLCADLLHAFSAAGL